MTEKRVALVTASHRRHGHPDEREGVGTVVREHPERAAVDHRTRQEERDDLEADGEGRVQARQRVLENDPDLFAPY